MIMRWLVRLLPICLVLVAAAMFVVGLGMPVHPDEAVFWDVGRVWWEAPSELYGSLGDNKPILFHTLNAVLVQLGGSDPIFFRTVVLGALIVQIGLLMILSNRFQVSQSPQLPLSFGVAQAKLNSRGTGLMHRFFSNITLVWIGGLMMMLWYQGNFWLTEPWMVVCLLLMMWCGVRGNWLAAGVLAVIAVLMRQTGFVGVLAYVAWMGVNRKVSTQQMTRFVMGGLATILVIALWMWELGMLHNFWQMAAVGVVTKYESQFSLWEFVKLFVPWTIWWSVGIVAWWRQRMRLWSWMVLAFVLVSWWRPYHHYWLQVIPWLLPLLAKYLQQKPLLAAMLAANALTVGFYFVWLLPHI